VSGTASEVARARWLVLRWPLAVAAVVLLVALVGALVVPRSSGGRLDPDSAAPAGSRALARILGAQGVTVDRVSRTDDAVGGARTGSTLVVAGTSLLGPSQLDRLAGTGADLVLIEPDALTLDRLVPGVRPAGVVPARDAEPGCSLPAAVAAGRVRAGDHLYRAGPAAGAVACYPDRSQRDAVSFLQADPGGRRVSVIGQSDLLTNEHLAEDGNAALSLHLLGARPRLTWYLPDPLELGRTQQAPAVRDLLPRWVPFVLVQLGVAVLLALLWRARRLGRLVIEPPPVVVRAAETQEGRARLYRQSGSRGRAGATLRTAALRRLAARLDVPAQASPEQVADLVAAITRRPGPQVRAVLVGPSPVDDAALVRLADELDGLEADVAAGTDRLVPAGTDAVAASSTEPASRPAPERRGPLS
jgi:hypothetical protein